MLWERHKTYVEYLATGGKGKRCASNSDHVEINDVCQQVLDVQGVSTMTVRAQVGY